MKLVVKFAATLGALVVAGSGAACAQSSSAAGDAGSAILSLLPLLTLSLPLAWGNCLLAVKSGRSGTLYVILTIIPIVGFIVTWYLIYTSLYRALDRQNA